MDDIYELLSAGFDAGQKIIEENELRFTNVENSLEAFLLRAKDTLSNRQVVHPKPAKQKRLMRTIPDESESEEEVAKVKDSAFKVPAAKKTSKDLQSMRSISLEKSNSDRGSSNELRPIRTAKSKANLNMKEVSLISKMRNDNNEVVVKREPSRSLRSSTESIKENRTPANSASEKRRSPDEGIQSAVESDAASTRSSKRSNSVEVISLNIDKIDLTVVDETEKMPPPKKGVKKTRTKQKPPPVVEEVFEGLRITRSKIKLEKLSITPMAASEASLPKQDIATAAPLVASKSVMTMNETVGSKKTRKKCPMPMLIKVEPEELPVATEPVAENILQDAVPVKSPDAPAQICNETFNVLPVLNETVTTAPAADPNTTSTIAKNAHDSLMTEDNDDEADVSMEVAPPLLPPKKQLPPVSALKLKKNEVFNPYLSSPVKQRVQAFEKHAVQATPDKYNTMPPKYGSLKAGTPSKIASYTKTTPLNLKTQKYTSASACNLATASASGYKATKSLKKGNSLSQEALDDQKKAYQAHQMVEEKRKAREEKQRLAAQQREAMEKEKREQALKIQHEREEKYRKIMREKEEKAKNDAMKKKTLKEKQAKKYAEEKSKNEYAQPKTGEASALNKNDSLHLKMQKQLLLDRSLQKKKEESKNVYSFEMLHTDDSTDDESRPSTKRPPPPEWSKKRNRKALIVTQSFVNSRVLDHLFSSKPISVDLRAIFPAIDSKKLVRNSSAVWRTPPKQY